MKLTEEYLDIIVGIMDAAEKAYDQGFIGIRGGKIQVHGKELFNAIPTEQPLVVINRGETSYTWEVGKWYKGRYIFRITDDLLEIEREENAAKKNDKSSGAGLTSEPVS